MEEKGFVQLNKDNSMDWQVSERYSLDGYYGYLQIMNDSDNVELFIDSPKVIDKMISELEKFKKVLTDKQNGSIKNG